MIFHFDSVGFKIGELVTEFYSGQDRHTTLTDPNPRLAESQLWPTMSESESVDISIVSTTLSK